MKGVTFTKRLPIELQLPVELVKVSIWKIYRKNDHSRFHSLHSIVFYSKQSNTSVPAKNRTGNPRLLSFTVQNSAIFNFSLDQLLELFAPCKS